MTSRKYKKKVLEKHYTDNPEVMSAIESAIDKLIADNEHVSKKAIKEIVNIEPHIVDSVYPHFAEFKKARIEMNCTIVQKKQWQHKAKQAEKTVSQLVTYCLHKLTIVVHPTEQLRKDINKVVTQRVRFNSLINQLAKWCNTYKSSAESLAVIVNLNALSKRFSEHDEKVMQILNQEHYFDQFSAVLPSTRKGE